MLSPETAAPPRLAIGGVGLDVDVGNVAFPSYATGVDATEDDGCGFYLLRDIVPDRTRLIHDTATDTSLEAGIVERHALVAGDRVLGPAVIVETQTTTLLSSRQQAIMQTDGCLLVTRTTPVSKEANP